LNSSGSPHSALKPIIQVATVNPATLAVDLKCAPTDFRRSWRAALCFPCSRFRQNCGLWRTHSIRNDVSQFHHLRTLLASVWSSFTSPCSLFFCDGFLYVAWANATDMPKGGDGLRFQFAERQSYSPKGRLAASFKSRSVDRSPTSRNSSERLSRKATEKLLGEIGRPPDSKFRGRRRT
jgi:hypothetical protein